MRISSLLAIALTSAVATSAHAQSCPSGSVSCRPNNAAWTYTEHAFTATMLDSGSVPASGPVTFDVGARLGGTTDIAMNGTPTLYWPAGIDVIAPGVAGSGNLTFNYGLTLTASVALSIGPLSTTINIPIPSLPSSLTLTTTQMFDPMLLSGAAGTRPVTATYSSPRITIVNFSLGTDSGGLHGNIQLDAQATFTATYQSDRVVVSNAADITTENAATLLSPTAGGTDFGASQMVSVHPEGTITYNVAINIFPTGSIAYGSLFTVPVPGTMIPLNINNQTSMAVFNTVTNNYLFPNAALTTTGVDFGTVTVGTTAHTMPVLVQNNGNDTLVITPSALSAPFSVATTPIMIAAGFAGMVPVGFAPTSTGPASTTLMLATNDPDTASFSVPVMGNGMAVVVVDAGAPDMGFDAGEPSDIPDAGVISVPDFGVDLGSGAPAPTTGGGCCAVAGQSSHARERGGLALIALSIVTVIQRRRRKSV